MLEARKPDSWIFWRGGAGVTLAAKFNPSGRFRQDCPRWRNCRKSTHFRKQGAGQARHRLMRRRSQMSSVAGAIWILLIDDRRKTVLRRSHRVILLGLFSTLLQARTLRLHKDARPLLLVEDPNPFTSHYASVARNCSICYRYSG